MSGGARTASIKIGIRADGGRVLGLGHLTRCLALADELRSAHGVDCRFYIRQDDAGRALVESRGWPVVRALSGGLEGVPPGDDLLVVDVPGGISAESIESLRASDPRRLLALFDGTCSGRLGADLVITPIERLSDPADWRGFHGMRFEGPAYAILNAAYSNLPPRAVDPDRAPRVLVTMGGADPYGLTLQALDALDTMPDDFQTTVAVGPAFSKEDELAGWLRHARRAYAVHREPVLAALMVASDIAVTSFGTSVYELAAAGLPAIALAISPDHAEAADRFARYGSLISAGLYTRVPRKTLANMVHELLGDPRTRMTMARAGQALVDGLGSRRVADLLIATVMSSAGR